MANERRLRLIQAAKEFNVGISTIMDFLQKKGIKCDGPSSLLTPDTYAVLEKEFGANRSATGARDSVRERIAQKQGTVSIDGEKPKEERELIIKSSVISVKEEVQQVRVLGKIDLTTGKPIEEKPEVKEEPTPAPVEESKPEPATTTATTATTQKAATQKSTTKRFTIQLMASAKPVSTSHAEFKSYRGKVWEHIGGGSLKYKYCIGDYATKAVAQEHIKAVRKEFPQAFIISFER